MILYRARLPSLYSDFQVQRHSNPDGFDANYTAWIDALTKAARAAVLPSPGDTADTLSIQTGEDLLKALETPELGRPLALRAVVDEAVTQRRLIPENEFLSSPKSIYGRQWTIQPWWLLSWALKQINIFGPGHSSPSLPARRFVVLQNAEDAGTKVCSKLGGKKRRVDRIYGMNAFKNEVVLALGLRDAISKNDVNILLKHLSRDMNAVSYDDEVVVFKDSGDHSPALMEEDKSIASLKALISELQGQVELLSMNIEKATEKSKSALDRKNRALALTSLKSKRLIEKALEQRASTLSQLEELYFKIEQAADQVIMVQTMEASTTVLRKLQSEVGNLDRVQEIVEDLKEESGKVDEIGNIIQEANQGTKIIDDDDVEEELEAMFQQTKDKQTVGSSEALPDVTKLPAPRESKDSQGLTKERFPSNSHKSLTDAAEKFDRLSLELPREEKGELRKDMSVSLQNHQSVLEQA
ncbi:uncharacterized protein KY384_007615 [Bacidia gigantensis]|uniref:uncharacterized protein n=1 Tax=Bacidia gigantensis TaxID=2732470 RepID=UPI001D03FAD0|nr:uncharacterized protein KY384_007615 [Bacidia gigantensis]KAG8527463.1 hypothetical protein KY384_007615 [Bacidia gigantensis]